VERLLESRKITCSICYEDICLVEPPLLGGKYRVTAEAIHMRNIVCPKVCHHLFHKACIEGWVREADTCPMCQGVNLRNSLVYFDGFANKYTKYLNEEINWRDFSPSDDAENLYPPLPLLPIRLRSSFPRGKNVAMLGTLIAFVAIPTYILALNVIEAKKRSQIAGGITLINLTAKIAYVVALNVIKAAKKINFVAWVALGFAGTLAYKKSVRQPQRSWSIRIERK